MDIFDITNLRPWINLHMCFDVVKDLTMKTHRKSNMLLKNWERTTFLFSIFNQIHTKAGVSKVQCKLLAIWKIKILPIFGWYPYDELWNHKHYMFSHFNPYFGRCIPTKLIPQITKALIFRMSIKRTLQSYPSHSEWIDILIQLYLQWMWVMI